MPATRARNVRRAAAKRTILSALDENSTTTNDSSFPSTSKVTIVDNKNYKMINDGSSSRGSGNENENGSQGFNISHHRPFCIPKGTDCTNTESINILLEDIEKEVKSLQESVAIKCCEAIKRQHEAYFLRGMKIEKKVKKMKIKDFNSKFMTNANGDSGDKANTDIIVMMKSLMKDDPIIGSGDSISMLGKKRFRDVDVLPGLGKMDLETPIRQLRTGSNLRTPATILRTAKRGEMLMSANGSPVEQCEDGALIATVAKKRRANGLPEVAAMLDINVGGRVISLSDPNSMSDLSNEMKNTVSAQLNVLQDQISKLMSRIDS